MKHATIFDETYDELSNTRASTKGAVQRDTQWDNLADIDMGSGTQTPWRKLDILLCAW